MELPRRELVERVMGRLGAAPVVALLGTRQCGKTTTARQVAGRWKGPVHRFDLEHPRDSARLGDPLLALEGLTGLVILDEIQRAPEVFPVLRVLADRPGTPARFLVLGSASPHLLRQSSETLAGRISFVEMDGFRLEEIGFDDWKRLWVRGGYPRSFLARSGAESFQWRLDLIATFLERDLPMLGSRAPAEGLRRFWTMLAHLHGQTMNYANLARALDVSAMTTRRHLDLLAATFVVKVLSPWSENLAKRQVKAPKVYLADSGILHALLGIESGSDLEARPEVGASWEGFALLEVVRQLGARWTECSYWRTHQGAELDLLVVRGRTRRGFEFKRTSAPRPTRSTHIACKDLGLDRLDIVYPGDQSFPLAEGIYALGLPRLGDDLVPLEGR